MSHAYAVLSCRDGHKPLCEREFERPNTRRCHAGKRKVLGGSKWGITGSKGTIGIHNEEDYTVCKPLTLIHTGALRFDRISCTPLSCRIEPAHGINLSPGSAGVRGGSR